MDKKFQSINSYNDARKFTQESSNFRSWILNSQLPDDSVFARVTWEMARNKDLKQLSTDIAQEFIDFEINTKIDIETVLRHVKANLGVRNNQR